MIVVFDTVRRRRPVTEGGELVKLDWETKKVLRSRLLAPTDPDILDDPNPRGNSRGGKGIVVHGQDIYVAVYHSILVLNHELEERRRLVHPLFAGLHEICMTREGLWVAATAVDAALLLDLDGRTLRSFWPREEPELREPLGLSPAPVDKGVDNRLLHLHKAVSGTPGHVHLNGVACHGGATYLLLNACGALVQVDPDVRVLVQEQRLRGGHTPRVTPDGSEIAVCSTFHEGVLFFERDSGRLTREVRLLDFPEVADLRRDHPDQPFSKSIFVRGLVPLGSDRFLVGISPAAVLEVDVRRHRLLDMYLHSHEVSDAVHGLDVLPQSTDSR